MRDLQAIEIASGTATVATCVAVGVLIAVAPIVGLTAALGIVMLGVFTLRHENLWRDLLFVGLAGAVVLGYGYANIGLKTEWVPFPVPLSAMLLLVLVARAAVGGWRFPIPAALVLAPLFLVVALIRLWFDYPVWGNAAIRDFTLPLESLWLVVGFVLMKMLGVRSWIRGFTFVFLLLLGYSALRPWYPQLAEFGPTVGLQRAIPLLGDTLGVGAGAVAGLFFFALLRPVRHSYLLAAAFVPIIVIDQYRGVYVATLASLIVVWLATRRVRATRARKAVAASMLVGMFGAALLFPFAPQGRVAEITPSNIASQVGTLGGDAGVGGGGVSLRMEWLGDVTREVLSTEYGLLIGVGLGPDLVGGFRAADEGPAVRKPHNDFLEVFARLGLLGLTVFLGLLLLPALRVARALHRVDELQARYLLWVLVVATALLVVAATQPLLSYPSGTMPLFLALGSGVGLAQAAASREPTATVLRP